MVFIDGAALRRRLVEYFGHDRVDLHALVWHDLLPVANFNIVHGELIRAYFYDGMCLPGDPDYATQKAYFDHLRRFDYCEVRLGRRIRLTDGKYRQKGVDVLMAIDMVGKAKDDQFDIAVLVAGDDDFVDMAQAVRDSGKRVCGIYFERKTSKRLLDCLDRRMKLTREALAQRLLDEKWKPLAPS